MKLAIVDDEVYWRDIVLKEIQKYSGDEFCIEVFSSGIDFLESEQAFDIVFVDVEMPEKDGFQVLKEYRQKYSESICIILTTHVELSRKGYQVDAFRYIDKECLEEIKEAMDSALLRLQMYQNITLNIISMNEKQIRCCDILYFEVYGHNVLLHKKDGEELKCNESLAKLSERLQEYGFIQPHRSYLVNMTHIKKIEPKAIFLMTNEEIPLSRRKYQELRMVFFDWKMQRANG